MVWRSRIEAIEQAAIVYRRDRKRDKFFEGVYPDCYTMLCRYFASHGLSSDDSHDLTHATLIQVYRKIHAFKYKSRFLTWVHSIAKRLYWKFKTTQRKNPMISIDELTSDEGCAPAEQLESQDPTPDKTAEHTRVLNEIKLLPARRRQCMQLHLEGYSQKEIAEKMGITTGAVGANIHFAKKDLENKYKEAEPRTNQFETTSPRPQIGKR